MKPAADSPAAAGQPRLLWPVLVPTLLLIPLFTWGGRILGERQAAAALASRHTSGSLPESSTPADPRRLPAPAPSATVSTVDAATIERRAIRLRQLVAGSPEPSRDVELEAEIAATLQDLPASALAQLYALFPPGNTMDWQLRQSVMTAWAEKDPAAALASFGTSPGLRPDMVAAQPFRDWMLRDAKAALAWLDSDQAPPMLSRSASLFRRVTLPSVAQSQPDLAFEQLGLLDHREAVSNLNIWLTGYDEISQATRDRALKLAEEWATPEELRQIRSGIASRLARQDPAAAREMAASLDLPASEALQLDARISLASDDLSDKALSEWLSRHPDMEQFPTAAQDSLSTWMSRERENAAQWLDSLPPGPQRDLIDEKAARNYIGFRNEEKAAELIARIDSPASRTQALKTLDRLWSLSRPASAAAWRAALPPSDRALLDSTR